MRRHPLAPLVALALALPSVCADDYACMDHGYARMPCHDELRLVGTDKLLLALAGHSCYSLAVAAPQPLEVYLYANVGLDLQPQRPSNASALGLGDVRAGGALSPDPHVCRGASTCEEVRQGLSPSTVYSLVIARSRGGEALEKAEQVSVLLDLQHCDPLSATHLLGLLMVGALGFTSALLLMCLVGEFVLGLRSISKLRKSVEGIRFVELAQMEPLTKVAVVGGGDEEATEEEEEEDKAVAGQGGADDGRAEAERSDERQLLQMEA